MPTNPMAATITKIEQCLHERRTDIPVCRGRLWSWPTTQEEAGTARRTAPRGGSDNPGDQCDHATNCCGENTGKNNLRQRPGRRAVVRRPRRLRKHEVHEQHEQKNDADRADGNRQQRARDHEKDCNGEKPPVLGGQRVRLSDAHIASVAGDLRTHRAALRAGISEGIPLWHGSQGRTTMNR